MDQAEAEHLLREAISQDALKKMSLSQRAEIAFSIAVSGLSAKPEMSAEERADILMEATRYYRLSVICDFVAQVTEDDDGKPFSLLLGEASIDRAKKLQSALALCAIKMMSEQSNSLKRLKSLMLLLKPGDAKATAWSTGSA